MHSLTLSLLLAAVIAASAHYISPPLHVQQLPGISRFGRSVSDDYAEETTTIAEEEEETEEEKAGEEEEDEDADVEWAETDPKHRKAFKRRINKLIDGFQFGECDFRLLLAVDHEPTAAKNKTASVLKGSFRSALLYESLYQLSINELRRALGLRLQPRSRLESFGSGKLESHNETFIRRPPAGVSSSEIVDFIDRIEKIYVEDRAMGFVFEQSAIDRILRGFFDARLPELRSAVRRRFAFIVSEFFQRRRRSEIGGDAWEDQKKEEYTVHSSFRVEFEEVIDRVVKLRERIAKLEESHQRSTTPIQC